MKTHNVKVKTIKAKDIQARTKPEPVAEASVLLKYSNDGDWLIISDIRIIQDEQGRVWVEMPTQIESSGNLQPRIEEKVLAFYELFEEGKGGAR